MMALLTVCGASSTTLFHTAHLNVLQRGLRVYHIQVLVAHLLLKCAYA
jgi:hypothetical protein